MTLLDALNAFGSARLSLWPRGQYVMMDGGEAFFVRGHRRFRIDRDSIPTELRGHGFVRAEAAPRKVHPSLLED